MHNISRNYTLFLTFWAKDGKNWLATSYSNTLETLCCSDAFLVSDTQSSCHSSRTHLNFNTFLALWQLKSSLLSNIIPRTHSSINKVAIFYLKVKIFIPPPYKINEPLKSINFIFLIIKTLFTARKSNWHNFLLH